MQFLLYDDVVRATNDDHDDDDDDDDTDNGLIWGWVVYWLFVVLVVTQLPCIRWLLRTQIRQTLEHEYFEMGELIRGGLDDSSLSTGSDSFFAYRRMESQHPTNDSSGHCP